ncbi:MAG TPA: hypothetical protein VMB83_00025 [Roseiarcus sp.]|nr:hypothetical protein [Roseiarcus sp.]
MPGAPSFFNIFVSCHLIGSVVVFRNTKETAETTTMRTVGSGRFSARTIRKTEEAALISEIAEELKKAASELYFAERAKRIVTLAHLAFANCDISIAMPGRGVIINGEITECEFRCAPPFRAGAALSASTARLPLA